MQVISILQVIISIILVVTILMQNRGSSLGGAFGGGGGASYHTKRGFEKFLSSASVGFALLFLLLALLNVYLEANF